MIIKNITQDDTVTELFDKLHTALSEVKSKIIDLTNQRNETGDDDESQSHLINSLNSENSRLKDMIHELLVCPSCGYLKVNLD